MKLVIKIAAAILDNGDQLARLLRSVASLSRDRHHVVLLHGDRTGRVGNIPVCSTECIEVEDLSAQIQACAIRVASVRCEAQYLAAGLARLGVPVLGLCGSDSGIFRLRKASRYQDSACGIEAVQVDPRWLQIICSNGGIPIISNLVLSAWGQSYLIDSDRMAAICAIDWRANALIYLTTTDGIRQTNGSVMRWLDVTDTEALEAQSLISGDMQEKLKLCRDALQRGVGRVHILPVANVDCLESVFDSRSEYGTEVFIRADMVGHFGS